MLLTPKSRIALALLILAATLPGIAQTAATVTTFRSPDGRFSIDIPAGWKLTTDSKSNQIEFHNGPVSFSVAVMPIDQGATVQQYLDVSDGDLQHECPTYKHRDTHPITLAGISGLTSVSTCNDPTYPAIAENSAAITSAGMIVTATAIAPTEHFANNIAIFDSIKASFHVPALPAANIPLQSAQATAAVIAEDNGSGTHHVPGATSYHDPHHRFTVDIPPGWTADPKGDQGSLGVQLLHDSDWIFITPSTASSASEAVLAHERSMVANAHLDIKPPFSSAGLIQIFSHGTELTYDTTHASNPDGSISDGLFAGIAPIGGGPAKLLFGASTKHTGDAKLDGAGLAAALSVRLE